MTGNGSLNLISPIKKEITPKDIRSFGLILGLILAFVSSRIFFKFHSGNFIYLAYLSGISVILTLFFPFLMMPVYRAWMKAAGVIGWFNTRVILILCFYIVMAPIGVFLRLVRRDLLGLSIDKKAASYWLHREKRAPEPGQYEKQF